MGHHNDVTWTGAAGLPFPNAQLQASFEDIVESDQPGALLKIRPAMLGQNLRTHTPRGAKFRLEKQAAREANYPQQVSKRVHGRGSRPRGVLAKTSGVPAISARFHPWQIGLRNGQTGRG